MTTGKYSRSKKYKHTKSYKTHPRIYIIFVDTRDGSKYRYNLYRIVSAL